MRYKFKTRPYRHQVKAIRKVLPSLREQRAAALLMPMRSGKTKTAIDLAAILHKKYGIQRVLVVAPLSVIGVWKKQIKIHKPDDVRLRWVLVNYEKVFDRKMYTDGWEPIPRRSLYKYKPQLIIVDEAHKIGNASAAQSRHLYKLRKYLRDHGSDPYVITLTGTAFHRKLPMQFGHWKLLSDEVFGTSVSAFEKEYVKRAGYQRWKILKFTNQKQFKAKLSPFTFLMKTLPFVAPQHEVVPYALEESEPAYRSMADDAIAWIGEGVVEAPIALTKALRLSQLCGGRLRDSEGIVRRVGKEKRREFEGLVELFKDNEVNKFVVFHRFVPEMKDSIEVCRDAGYKVYLMYGKTPGNKREQRIAEFDETDGKAVFISQVSTGALGIDLSAASVAVFYSLPESLVDYDQDCARIRKWKDKRTLTYYYLIGEGTIEEVTLSALKANMDLIEALTSDPMLLSYSARG